MASTTSPGETTTVHMVLCFSCMKRCATHRSNISMSGPKNESVLTRIIGPPLNR
jgi:hypothetical protein